MPKIGLVNRLRINAAGYILGEHRGWREFVNVMRTFYPMAKELVVSDTLGQYLSRNSRFTVGQRTYVCIGIWRRKGGGCAVLARGGI